jgi:hypothetical protein
MPQDEFEVVVFDFSLTGRIAVKTEGFEGPSCVEAVRDVAEGLGEVTHVEYTADFHKKPKRSQEGRNVVRRSQ